MKHKFTSIAVITVLAGLTAAATHAQTVVVSDDFESYGLGTAYGTTYNFGDANANPGAGIAPAPGGVGQAFEFFANLNSNVTANTGVNLPVYTPTNNNSDALSDYTLSFDMAIPDGSTNAGFGVVFNIFGNNGDSVNYNPDLSQITVGGGYHHYVVNMGTLGSVNGQPLLEPRIDTSYQVQVAILGFPPRVTVAPEELQFDNVLITITNQIVVPPPPAVHVLAATPGSRWFAQNSSQVYNEEGLATVDTSQSWVGSATPAAPSSYSVKFADWNTAPNFRYQIQFVPNAAVNPFSVFTGPNDFALTITRQATNFLATVDYKTNLPNAGTVSNLLSMTTSNAAVGTWTLSFTSDTNGTVTAPDGETGSFLVPPGVAVIFTNPCPIFYGIAPFNTQGYGQWVDIDSITTTNVAGVAINDDFTKDDGLDANVWNAGYSLDTGSIIQISTNTPYWVTWTFPAYGFGLEAKATLTSGTNGWFSPNYYGSGVGITATPPTLMGPTNYWTLIPRACLPTVDGTTNGPVSPTGYFRLSNPPPAQ